MKKVLYTVLSILRKLYLFFWLHIHVEAGVRSVSKKDDNDESVSDDPDDKE